VLGTISKPLYELDDWVLMRPDGIPTYNFACVVDDHMMKITLAIRGQEHVNSTIPQVNLWNTLGWKPCTFAHLPLIMSESGEKLSKRKHKEADVVNHKRNGILKEALLNYVVKLGWGHGNTEIFDRQEMENCFSLAAIGTASGKWDEKKLHWVNQEWMKKLDANDVAHRLIPFLEAVVPAGSPVLADSDAARTLRRKLVEALRERSSTLKEMAEKAEALFLSTKMPEIDKKAGAKFLNESGKTVLKTVEEALKAAPEPTWSDPAGLMKVITQVAETRGQKLNAVAQPLRVALTGNTASPGMGETLELIGKPQTLARIAAGLTATF